MKTNRTNGKLLVKLNLNKKTRTIKIDVYNLYNEKFDYMYTAICNKMNKEEFEYYYNNTMTFNDIQCILIRQADKIIDEYKDL